LIFNKYGAGILIHRFITVIVTLVSNSPSINSSSTFSLYVYLQMQFAVNVVVWQFCSNEKADEIEEFFASRMHPAFGMNLKRSIEQVRIKARWVENIKREQSLQDLLKRLARKKS
jgi:hypothetical protein